MTLRRRPSRLWVALGLVACLTLTGCGGEGQREADVPQPVREGPGTPGEEPVETELPITDGAVAVAPDELTGLGASRAAWESVRGGSVSGFVEGAAYGPVVRGDTHEYFGVDTGEPISYFSRAFPEGTALETAKSLVLADLPADAQVVVEDRDEADCLIALVDSEELRAAGWDNAILGFFSGPDDPLIDSDVWFANVFVGSGEEGPDLGFC